MAHLSIHLLGPFEASLDGVSIAGFRSDKVRVLLGYLALERDQPHRRESLAAFLWPESPEPQARHSLRSALANLHACLGREAATPPHLLIEYDTVQFNSASYYSLDISALLEDLPSGQVTEAEADRVRRAVDLYRGDLFEGLSIPDSAPLEQWAANWREHLLRRALEYLHWLAMYELEVGDGQAAQRAGLRAVELDPLDERAHRDLMWALAASGERAAALAQFEACRRILQAELQTGPDPETIALYDSIRRGTPQVRIGAPSPTWAPSLVSAHPTGRTLAPVPTNLPAQALPFIGRKHLLGDILERLHDPACRLLTLVGPGGCGKTRLALEAGERLVSNRACRDDAEGGPSRGAAPTDADEADLPLYAPRDGVFLVSLAPLRSAETIAPTISAAVGFSLSGGDPRPPEGQLLDYLRNKAMLLILDSCEHLLQGAGLVSAILESGPAVKVLATTREWLKVQGEHLLPVGGMELPEMDAEGSRSASEYSAVQLFLQRARQVRPGYEPSPEELEQISQICRRVRGMPLAIVLAAGWMGMLPPGEIDAEIVRSLDFLAGGARDLPERQRSVRASFDYSWRLLTPQEQRAFAALSVCRGSFDREAACAVSGATLPTLRALVDKSLLQGGAGGRFEAHELLRQFAAEMLGRSPEASRGAHERHAVHYMALLTQLDPRSRAKGWDMAPTELRPDIENARAAWEWSVAQGDLAPLEAAIAALCWFYWSEGRNQEGIEACDLALTAQASPAETPGRDAGWAPGQGEMRRPNAPSASRWPRLRGQALTWKGCFQHWRAEYERARATFRQGLEALQEAEAQGCDVHFERALALYRLSDYYQVRGDMTESLELAEESMMLFREVGDSRWAAHAQMQVGYVAFLMGRGCAEGRRALEESVAILRQLDDHSGLARTLGPLAMAAAYGGDSQRAERLAREALATIQEREEPRMIGLGTLYLGLVLIAGDGFAEAESLLEGALVEPRGMNDQGTGSRNYVLGVARMHRGAYAQARLPLERAEELCRQCGSLGAARATYTLGALALAERAWAEAAAQCGEALPSLRRSGMLCLEGLSSPMLAELRLGHEDRAKVLLLEDLRASAATDYAPRRAGALAGAAVWLAEHGQTERAVEVYALASQHPQTAASRWWEDVAGNYVAAAARALPAEVVIAAQERGRARHVQAALHELLAELVS
jgi:predicted ATPase/DNA-binding SARP family transcriptional activator